MKFYFQYDKDRHKAKVVFDGDPDNIETFFVDTLVCEVPVKSVLSNDTPKFVMRGECDVVWYGSKVIRLTNEK